MCMCGGVGPADCGDARARQPAVCVCGKMEVRVAARGRRRRTDGGSERTSPTRSGMTVGGPVHDHVSMTCTHTRYHLRDRVHETLRGIRL